MMGQGLGYEDKGLSCCSFPDISAMGSCLSEMVEKNDVDDILH